MKEKTHFYRTIEQITPSNIGLLRKYKSTRRVDNEDIPSINRLKNRVKNIIWHEGFLDEDIKPNQFVGMTIFGRKIYDTLVEKGLKGTEKTK